MAQFETGAVGTVYFEPGGVFFWDGVIPSRNAAASDAGESRWFLQVDNGHKSHAIQGDGLRCYNCCSQLIRDTCP